MVQQRPEHYGIRKKFISYRFRFELDPCLEPLCKFKWLCKLLDIRVVSCIPLSPACLKFLNRDGGITMTLRTYTETDWGPLEKHVNEYSVAQADGNLSYYREDHQLIKVLYRD